MARMPLREEGLCGRVLKASLPVAQTPSVKAPPLYSFIVHKTHPVSIHPDFMKRERAPAEPLLSPARASKRGRNGQGPWEGIQKGMLGSGGGGTGQGFQVDCKKLRSKGRTPKNHTPLRAGSQSCLLLAPDVQERT